jgi:hypothetical protein
MSDSRGFVFSQFNEVYGLGNRSSILLSYRVIGLALYSFWHPIATRLCLLITQKHTISRSFTKQARAKHGKVRGPAPP